MRKICLLFLIIAVVCTAFCACGEDNGTNNSASEDASVTQSEETSNVSEESAVSEESSASVDDGKVSYKVTIADENGNGMAGVMVQLCYESCCPAVTDANGVATFVLEEADYKASVMNMPEGYTYAVDANEYHFEEGSTSLTINLTTAE